MVGGGGLAGKVKLVESTCKMTRVRIIIWCKLNLALNRSRSQHNSRQIARLVQQLFPMESVSGSSGAKQTPRNSMCSSRRPDK